MCYDKRKERENMRFRKRIKLGGINLNLSGSGVGFSIGVPGLRTGISSTGRRYSSFGIPGTGLYDVKYHSSKKTSEEQKNEEKTERFQSKNYVLPSELNSKQGCLWSFITFILICNKPEIGFISLILQIIWHFIFYKKSEKYLASKLFKNSVKFIKEKNFGQARDLCMQILLKFPNIREVKEMITETYIAENNYDDALTNMQKYVSSVEDKLELLELAYIAEKYQFIIDNCQDLPSEIRSEVYIITMLGSCYYSLGKSEIALEVLLQGPTRKRKMDLDIAEFRYMLGVVYESLNQKKNAIKQYNKIMAFDSFYRDVAERLDNLEK